MKVASPAKLGKVYDDQRAMGDSSRCLLHGPETERSMNHKSGLQPKTPFTTPSPVVNVENQYLNTENQLHPEDESGNVTARSGVSLSDARQH